MVTLKEILEDEMGCDKAFCGTGDISFEGKDAVKKIIQFLKDLAELGIIPDVSKQAESKFAEMANKPRSNKEQMIYELHEFVKRSDVDYVLRMPILVQPKNGDKFSAGYFSRDEDYSDIFCSDKKGSEDDATVYDLQDLTDESVKKVYESIKSQEIEDGWGWKEHATHEIKKKYPDASDCSVSDFVTEYWNDLDTDTANLEVFEDWNK